MILWFPKYTLQENRKLKIEASWRFYSVVKRRFPSFLTPRVLVERIAMSGWKAKGILEVEHGEHPFVIQTDSAQIKVLVLSLTLKLWWWELYKGITPRRSIVLLCINQEFIMKPNQTMTVNKLDQTYKLTESADYAEQWINCKVFWDEVPMSIISKELERQFDVTFAFESEQLKNLIFYGSFYYRNK